MTKKTFKIFKIFFWFLLVEFCQQQCIQVAVEVILSPSSLVGMNYHEKKKIDRKNMCCDIFFYNFNRLHGK